MNKQLNILSRKQFEKLKTSGMLWELYPDANEIYEFNLINRKIKIGFLEGIITDVSYHEKYSNIIKIEVSFNNGEVCYFKYNDIFKK